MKPAAKVALVAGGYLLAIVVACAIVAIYVTATSGPDRLGSDGMYAFGDSLVFLAAFGLAAIPATCAALYFLRTAPRFWTVLSVLALAIATTGLVMLVAYFMLPATYNASTFGGWAAFAPIRALIAPLFALAFLLAGLFSPRRSSRLALLLAMAIEAAIFAAIVSRWIFHG
jgi:hypothetical protein